MEKSTNKATNHPALPLSYESNLPQVGPATIQATSHPATQTWSQTCHYHATRQPTYKPSCSTKQTRAQPTTNNQPSNQPSYQPFYSPICWTMLVPEWHLTSQKACHLTKEPLPSKQVTTLLAASPYQETNLPMLPSNQAASQSVTFTYYSTRSHVGWLLA